MAEYRKNCWNLHVRIKALHSPGLESGEQKHQTVINGKSFIQSSEEPASCRATLGFISMKQSCETVRVINSPREKQTCACVVFDGLRGTGWCPGCSKYSSERQKTNFFCSNIEKVPCFQGERSKRYKGVSQKTSPLFASLPVILVKKNSLSTKLVSHHKHLNKYYYSDCNL